MPRPWAVPSSVTTRTSSREGRGGRGGRRRKRKPTPRRNIETTPRTLDTSWTDSQPPSPYHCLLHLAHCLGSGCTNYANKGVLREGTCASPCKLTENAISESHHEPFYQSQQKPKREVSGALGVRYRVRVLPSRDTAASPSRLTTSSSSSPCLGRARRKSGRGRSSSGGAWRSTMGIPRRQPPITVCFSSACNLAQTRRAKLTVADKGRDEALRNVPCGRDVGAVEHAHGDVVHVPAAASARNRKSHPAGVRFHRFYAFTYTITCSNPRNTNSMVGKWMARILLDTSRALAPSHTAVHTRKLQPIERRTHAAHPSDVLATATVWENVCKAGVYRPE